MNMSQQPMLPPIQQLNAQPQNHPPQMHQHQQYAQPAINGGHMQHPPPPPNPYAYHDSTLQQGHMPPEGALNGQGPMRFPIADHRLAGSRQKKEIKRRTKTGCLTCRKRRIKCDEGHPACRNCLKSKRECLGYDPIFKAQGTPAAIQPAPGSTPSLTSEPSFSGSRPPAVYPPAPHGYAPAASAGYASAMPTQSAVEHNYDYGAALDPALATGHQPPESISPPTYTTSLHSSRNVAAKVIDDLFNLESLPPILLPPQNDSQPLSEGDMQDMKGMYMQDYALGLDRFFETTWYSTQGESLLGEDQNTAKFFKHCVERFRRPPNQPEELQALPSLEARLVWTLAILPRSASDSQGSEVADLLRRVNVVQDLLTGAFSDYDGIPHAPSSPPLQLSQQQRAHFDQALFWHHLGRFTSIHDDSSDPAVAIAVNSTLGAMRNVLNVQENRDVLYSMAIARHYGGRQAEYFPDRLLVATSNDPEDPMCKLVVAQRFIGQEESSGTSQVVQRLCGMAKSSWTRHVDQKPVQSEANPS